MIWLLRGQTNLLDPADESHVLTETSDNGQLWHVEDTSNRMDLRIHMIVIQ